MPSFASASAELRLLAKKWRLGTTAFKDLLDVAPRREGEVYNKLLPRKESDALHLFALQEVNNAYARQESAKRTRDARQRISKAKEEGVDKKQLRQMRIEVNKQRGGIERQIFATGGMPGAINTATDGTKGSRSAYYNKLLLTLNLGEYLCGFDLDCARLNEKIKKQRRG
mgnify:CR=1 FL=1